ncbi:MAG TPA: hypothetical protein VKI19_16305, partial [Acidimicrobiales bacterium]|nr:hypothetical protein [Acidimicrobiales bacterium]
NPFGRTGGPAAAPPPPSAPAPSGPRPVPTPRTGPSILAGGISNGLSPMSPGTGGVGGSVSGLRPPPANPGLAGGLGARPLPGVSGMAGVSSNLDEPVEEATIQLRRPTRRGPADPPTAEVQPAPPPPAPAAPARPAVPLAAWNPSDDDILPRGPMKRKGRRR